MSRKANLSTTTLLFALTLLAASLVGVSAVPKSPYIMVVPEKTLDTALTPGSTYTISLYTDYAEDSDVWTWQFGLTFNPAVLRGTTVTNGDLITVAKDPSAIFEPGAFNNTEGSLALTTAYFDRYYYEPPPPGYPTTSGPGTLAIVSFEVIGYGSSNIMLVESKTRLLGALGLYTYPIIYGIPDFDHLGHGYFSNKLIGDANSDRRVDARDLRQLGKAYASTVGPPTSPNWDSDCDFNHDFKVNATDLSELRNNYGESI